MATLTWDDWIARYEEKFETEYEGRFVREILREVPNLSPSIVVCQTWFKDLEDGNRRIDFTIAEGRYVRIALEVDGFKKNPDANPDETYFEDWLFRELSMTAQGWVPLRFANASIAKRPEALKQSIELQLEMQRRIGAIIEEGGDAADRAKAERQESKDAAQEARRGKDAAEEAEAKIQELKSRDEDEYLDDYEKDQLRAADSKIDELNRELDEERKRRRKAEEKTEEAEEERDETKKESKKVKWMYVLLALVVLAGIAFLWARPFDSGDPSQPNACVNATPASELTSENLGERVEAKGVVEQATKIDAGVFLNLGGLNGSQDLTVVIWEDNLDNFSQTPEGLYDGREIAATGELDEFEGTLQIEVDAKRDIAICD